jgi:hypothetical protein
MSVQQAGRGKRQSAKKAMELATIPGTKLKVSRVTLGTWAIGGWMWDRRGGT